MLDWIRGFLVRYPELALFLTIGVGYWFGALRFWGFRFGPVTGSLFAGIAIGQLANVPISGMTKSFLFLLFLFGIGYSVGPQFMQALKRDGLRPMVLAVVVCSTGLIVAFAVARLLNLDAGFAAGLVSGALTESPAMGTATEAINLLPLPEEERARLVAHIAVADAVCYLFGAIGMIWFCTVGGPKLLGIDLKTEARQLEQALGIERDRQGVVSAWRPFELRAYRLDPDAPAVHRTLREAEAMVAESRVFVHRIRRGQDILDASPELRLLAGDVLAVTGKREVLLGIIGRYAEEVEDRTLLDVPVASVDILLTNHDVIGRRLDDIAQSSWARIVYLRSVRRGDQQIPITAATELQRGDLLRVVGAENAVAAAATHIGTVVQPTEATDFVVLGLAIFLGGLAGVLIQIPIGDMRISLSTSVGTLLAGLLVGHLRTRFPLFGRIPDGAVSLMTALGLAAFVASTGLHAGPIFFGALREAGIGLFLGGIFVTLVPQLVGLYFGRYILGMHPILLLGALAGAQTFTAAMAAVQERSGSPVAVLGFTPAIPLGHILLTTWGTIIVGLIA